MKNKTIEFIGSYKDILKMPKDGIPEIAFIGRSNVGKSTLINTLLQSKVAKTSGTPGKTQLINFFKIDSKYYVVDLPGYGFAKVQISIKKEWEEFIETYLRSREQLKIVVLLLDIRREPNEHDKVLVEWMKSLKDCTPIYVLTKADKISNSAIQGRKAVISKELFISQHEMVVTSSLEKSGTFDLSKKIEAIVKEAV